MGRRGTGLSGLFRFPSASEWPLGAAFPAELWDGTSGSGFTSPPTDPERITAKPGLRLMVPPFQYFMDELVIGVAAMANNQGSLRDNLGLEMVRVYFESDTPAEIRTPSFRTFADANGKAVTYYGWWITLVRPEGKSGLGNVFFEAVPADDTIQNRVLGPFQFGMDDAVHDAEIEIAPSQPEIAGARYQSLKNAFTYCRDNALANPLLTIVEAGEFYSTGQLGGPAYTPQGWVTVQADLPVTFGLEDFLGDDINQMRPKMGGLRFKGANITFDMRNVSNLFAESSKDWWLDGVSFINSAGRPAMWRQGVRPTGHVVRGNPWLTECSFYGLPNACNSASLVRGCTLSMGYGDTMSDALCAVGNRVDDWDASVDFLLDIPAMDVTYAGTEADATLALTSYSDANGRVLTAQWGANSASFTVGSSKHYWSGASGDGYSVQDVADWLNSLEGWSASVLDNSRRASALGLPDGKGAGFSGASAKDVTLQLMTCFDIHGDFYQMKNGGPSNVVIVGNIVSNYSGQDIFLGATTPALDYFVVNNAFHNKTGPIQYGSADTTFSQMARSQHSHVVIAHNSWATQGFRFNTYSGLDADSYCLFGNNSVRSLAWSGSPDEGVTIVNNHLHDGETGPDEALGTTIGGDAASLYVDAGSGDFTPVGALLSVSSEPLVHFDHGLTARGAAAPVGAIGSN